MSRPEIEIHPAFIDKLLYGAALILLFLQWGVILTSYDGLPDIIPVHYNASGEVNRFGDKSTILMLPVISTILFALLSYIARHPHKYNYLVEITPQNAAVHYTLAARLMRWLRLSVVIIFLLIVGETLWHIEGKTNGLSTWTLPFILAIIFIPIFYYLIKSSAKS